MYCRRYSFLPFKLGLIGASHSASPLSVLRLSLLRCAWYRETRGRQRTDVKVRESHQHILGVFVLDPPRSLPHSPHVSLTDNPAASCLPICPSAIFTRPNGRCNIYKNATRKIQRQQWSNGWEEVIRWDYIILKGLAWMHLRTIYILTWAMEKGGNAYFLRTCRNCAGARMEIGAIISCWSRGVFNYECLEIQRSNE